MRVKLGRMLLLASLVISAALSAPFATAQGKAPLRFGVAMPLTGSAAPFGVDFVEAARWAVADINAKGGVDGHPLEMVLADTMADPQTGINAVNKLVHVEKVPVLLTAWSGVVKAIAPIANREKSLVLSVGAGSPEVAKLGDYIYTTTPLSDVDVKAMAKYSVEKLGKKRAAVLFINNETGVSGAVTFRAAFEKAGGQVVTYEAYDANATSFSGPVLKARAANPDIIYVHGLLADMPQVIVQVRQMGIKEMIASYSGGFQPKLIEQVGPSLAPYMVTSLAPGVESNPNVAGFIERWQKTKGRVTNALPYTQFMYDSGYVVAELYRWVLKNNLPVTGENMRKALLATKTFDLPMTGALEVKENHEVMKPTHLWVVKDGKFVPFATVGN